MMIENGHSNVEPVSIIVGPSSPDQRPPIRNSIRQQRIIIEGAPANNHVEIVSTEEHTKRHGHLHGDSEFGYTITVHPTYFRSICGFLKVVEIIIAIIICATVDASQCVSGILCGSASSPMWYGVLGGQGFVILVCIICILGNIAFIIYHLLKRRSLVSKLADRIRLGELIYDIAAIVLFVIAGCIEAWYASWITMDVPNSRHYEMGEHIIWNPYRPQWIAATIFAWINAVIYAADAICMFFFDDDAPRSGQFSK